MTADQYFILKQNERHYQYRRCYCKTENMIRLLGRLGNTIPGLTNTDFDMGDWYFVDYSETEVMIGTKFIEVKLPGFQPGPIEQLRLISVVDHLGNRLSGIPEGYKTVCRLASKLYPKFAYGIILPHCDTWIVNDKAILLYSKDDKHEK